MSRSPDTALASATAAVRGEAPDRAGHRADRRWRLAWLLLTAAVAGHVADEALNDFLTFYNPTAEAIREVLPWLPLATFTFEEWITSLAIGIVALAALTPLASGDRIWMRVLSRLYGVVMALNGLLHLGLSWWFGRWVPGVISSPFVFAAALFLLASVPRRQDRKGSVSVAS